MVRERQILFDLARGKFLACRLERPDFPRFAQGACDWGFEAAGAWNEKQSQSAGRKARHWGFGTGDWRFAPAGTRRVKQTQFPAFWAKERG